MTGPIGIIQQHHTFTASGQMPNEFHHQGRYSQIVIGEVTAQDMGGGTLLIQKSTLNGGRHTIRSITAAKFLVMQDRTLRLELPSETSVYVELVGATAPNLYIEHRQQQDVRS